MAEMGIFTFIIIVHTIADFFLQTDEQAKGKSTSHEALANHIIFYTLSLIFACVMASLSVVWIVTGDITAVLSVAMLGILWSILNGCLHYITDYITSRASSYAWSNENRHDFFCIIGVDQAIHVLTLCWTAYAVKTAVGY